MIVVAVSQSADYLTAAALDGVEAGAIDVFGLEMGVGQVGGFSETIVIESDYSVPSGIGQHTGHLVAVMLRHNDDEIGGVKQFLGHRNGFATHLISMLNGNAAHDSIPFQISVKLRAA